ncbi:MAG: DnaJ domain-containing protein [Nitrospirota bacterium]
MAEESCTDQTPIPLSGDIKQMTIPWLFQSIRARSMTGTAVFDYIQDQTAEKVAKKIYFKNGDITFAASSLQEDWLGRSLVRAGKLTEQQCAASEELVSKTRKKQGAILVELGFMTPQALVEGVKLQVMQIILSLFRVRMGTYRFDEGPLPMADIIPLQMSTGNVILEGVTSLEWQAIRKSLPAPTTIVRPATDPSCLFQDAHLTDEQRTVFSFIDGKRSIEEICGLSGVGDFNAMKAMFLLLSLRMAEIGKIKTDAEMEFAREAVREAVRPAREKKEEKKPERPAEPEVIATRETIQKAYDALAAQDHYQVLGVTVTSTAQQLKHAYFRLAKSYHPDRHFDPTMADMKNKLEALFDRIHKAYTILSDQARRAEYDAAVLKRAAQSQKRPAASDEFVEQRGEDYQEHYKENTVRAAEQFNSGMQEFKTGNYWGAEEKFAWATRLDPIKAPYFYYLGLCLMNIPRRKHESEENLQKAIEIDPTKIEYHIELSNLYIKSGLKTKAIGVLNNALNHHPDSPRINEAIAAAGEGKLSAVAAGETKQQSGARPKVTKGNAAQALEKFNGGMKELRANNFGAAVNGLADAAKLDPTKAQYQYYLGICLLNIARRRDDAEEPLRKALELDAAKLEHHLELGNFYIKSGHKTKGLGILNNALMRFPDAPKLTDAIKAAGGTVAGSTTEEKKSGMFSKLFKK